MAHSSTAPVSEWRPSLGPDDKLTGKWKISIDWIPGEHECSIDGTAYERLEYAMLLLAKKATSAKRADAFVCVSIDEQTRTIFGHLNPKAQFVPIEVLAAQQAPMPTSMTMTT